MPLAIRRGTAVASVVGVLSLPLYALFPTAVGLNDDLERYGIDGLQLLCGTGQRVWANYSFEPVYVGIWLGLAKVWSALFTSGVDYCTNPGLDRFWMPIFASTVMILGLVYAVRHLGGAAFCFHMLLCLDTALMLMPFNLVRQFVAVVILMALLSLVVREKIAPAAFVVALSVPALVHWSVWLLAPLGGAALLVSSWRSIWASLIKLSSRLSSNSSIGAGVALLGACLLLMFMLPRVQASYATKILSGVSLESSIRGLVSPITLAVAVFSYSSGRALPSGFLRTFLMGLPVLYFLVAVSGNVPAMERLRTIALPVSYFVFLYLLHRRTLGARWHLFSAAILLFVSLSYTWHALILKPFDGRPSFTQLYE